MKTLQMFSHGTPSCAFRPVRSNWARQEPDRSKPDGARHSAARFVQRRIRRRKMTISVLSARTVAMHRECPARLRISCHGGLLATVPDPR